MEIFKLIIEILLFLAPLAVGARYGPLALIGMSGVSVFILVEALRLQPGSPPITAIFIILAVIVASAAMSAAGGMDFLVRIAGKAMGKHPKAIPVVGPLIVWLFTVMSGTGNITFALIPIMYRVSYSAKIRPERILATANAVCQLALMSSPVAAITYVFINIAEKQGEHVGLGKLLAVTVPASLIATVLTSLIMSRYGKELDDDPEYQRRLAAGEVEPPAPLVDDDLPPLRERASWSAYIFLIAVVLGVVLGFFEKLRPTYSKSLEDGSVVETHVSMSFMIPIVMFAAAGLIMVMCKVKTPEVLSESMIGTGVIAALLLLAVPVLAGTIINDHMKEITSFVESSIGVSVALFAVILFVLAALIQSQVASVSVLLPIALTAGLGVGPAAGMLGAAGGNNLLASMGGLGQACIMTDKTGSTKQGSILINGSFLVPMLLSSAFAVAIGLGMQFLVF
ncbi:MULTISPECIES: anaerobic C4-dicarboxylate transporter family protein [unclassified Gordonia (in: high G+C Gram-positive bacteria)]|uniref:anaerobic C4-dicarboxylate transporter family protein n=1 Tax=unclassified Gordonia (in: high G+C Gram-positive bacteria) TaxID=2657482 RepID=UPI001FFE8A94|nr:MULTISPECIES: anaerobic C4-dicarboxylate transporter family protein [unclassified Gordonia (in: high G+C Gram-positive bacteria)]UQE76216.1 anaerobic C4-dicarboxylate transporter family protein [Gordonia sp. PP30]